MGWDHNKCMEQPPPLDSGSPTSSWCVLRRTGFEVPGSAPHRDNTAGGGGTMSRLSSSNQFQQPVLLHGKFTRCPISHDASCPSDCVVTEAPLRKHASVCATQADKRNKHAVPIQNNNIYDNNDDDDVNNHKETTQGGRTEHTEIDGDMMRRQNAQLDRSIFIEQSAKSGFYGE